MAASGAGAAARADASDRPVAAPILGRTGTPGLGVVLSQGLQELGWSIGKNLRVEYRWGGANADAIRKHATELAALAPDAILAHGAEPRYYCSSYVYRAGRVPSRRRSGSGSGFVDSLPRPGGNATGFLAFEFSLSGKWLELLKEFAPRLTRAAVLRDFSQVSGTGQFGAIQSVAPSLGVEVRPVNVNEPAEIERAVAAFARGSAWRPDRDSDRGGAAIDRALVIALAARHRLPAVYFERSFVAAGGLISYGPDFVDQYLRAAGYVDRILKGEKPADLPVQAPTKYELVINLKTAKTLGLEVPPTLLARADEVIE